MSKWVDRIRATDAVHSVAKTALKFRIRAVKKNLAGATTCPAEPEYVHQLRVACRRSNAALATFQDWYPRARRKRLRMMLRDARRAAGAARDLDVMALRLGQCEYHVEIDREPLLQFIAQLRLEAQPPLEALNDTADDLFQLAKEVRRKTRWRGQGQEPSYGCWAEQAIRDPLKSFVDASRCDLSELTHLHKFRIAGKRLRYAVELLACHCSPKKRKQVGRDAARIQQRLGDINDHAAASALLNQWSESETARGTLESELKRVAQLEADLAITGQVAFLKWWDEKRARSLKQAIKKMYAT